ncbi:MAG: tetratricopeptide repeat protein [Chloroflexi bacterium]|nr:tetratricopeptide repeat protein [Chloroflexota bacterium]
MVAFSSNPFVLQASQLIEQRTGLAASAQFRANLEPILNEIAQGNLARLVQTLHDTPETAPAWQKLLQTLAIGETYFFRHQVYFQLLKNYILPDLIPQRRRATPPRLNVWSAGCATGEEPYSIAITLHEYLPDIPHWSLQIIGTDINLHALQAAQKAIYRRWAFRHTSAEFQSRYFDPVPGGLQLKPAIRRMVSFRQGNLSAAPPLLPFDIIFCCNVLIYFEEQAARQVETMLYEALTPGGWLVLGQAEMLRFQRDRWTTHIFPDAVAYQKPVTPGETTRNHTKPLPSLSATVPASPIPAGYTDAVRALRRKDYDEADRILSGILEQNPTYAAAHVLVGSLFANRQALPEAHMHLDTALRLDPLLADAHYLRGLLHLEMGKTEAARESLKAALYCQRGHTLAAMILGHLLTKTGENARARRVWEEALHALTDLAPDALVSDISDITARAATAFISSQLKTMGG